MTAPVASPVVIPTGRWELDPAHSTLEFRVRHVGLARVRGVFSVFGGVIETASDGTLTAAGWADAASLTTGVEARDTHLRSGDFFDVAQHPRLTFRSSAIELGSHGLITARGALTIRGVTREIELAGEVIGTGLDDDGAERLGIELTARLDRREFGLTWNAAIDGGGLLVANRVDLALELSAVRGDT